MILRNVTRRVSALGLFVLASGMTGCLSSDTFQVRIEIDEEKPIVAPSMVIYVMLCDPTRKFKGIDDDDAHGIEKWVREATSKGNFEALSKLKPPRATRFIVKRGSNAAQSFEFTADDDARETGELIAIAVFADTTNHANQYRRVVLKEHPDKEVFAFKLDHNSLEFLTEVEE